MKAKTNQRGGTWRHHLASGRSALATLGAAGLMVAILAIVVPSVLPAGTGRSRLVATAGRSGNVQMLTYTSIPKPGSPIVLPKPVTLTVTPVRAMGNPNATVIYTVRWRPPHPPRTLPGERPGWVVNLKFVPTEPAGNVIARQWRLPPWKRMWTGEQQLKPGIYTVVVSVTDDEGEIGFATVEDVEVIPPPTTSTTTKPAMP